ncbi:unnamed protein product [Phytophthora lilii]|uniref:Unnamed protein product n=1 Tax=Phytophthora lilii TaxID=2077276 RepID=A0A9W6XD82_9STRA|nr:unnamed protein product [Phytophthora lilii]
MFTAFTAQQQQARDLLQMGLQMSANTQNQGTATGWSASVMQAQSRRQNRAMNASSDLNGPDGVNILTLLQPVTVSAATLIRVFASVDIKLDGLMFSIGAAMAEAVLQLPEVSRTVLRLDGKTRDFESLPNGLSPSAGAALFSGFWGAKKYKGRLAEDGPSVELLLLSLPPPPEGLSRDGLRGITDAALVAQ